MASIVHFDASAPLEDISAQLDEDAAVIIDNVLSGDQLSALRSDPDPYLHDVAHGRDVGRVGCRVHLTSPKTSRLSCGP